MGYPFTPGWKYGLLPGRRKAPFFWLNMIFAQELNPSPFFSLIMPQIRTASAEWRYLPGAPGRWSDANLNAWSWWLFMLFWMLEFMHSQSYIYNATYICISPLDLPVKHWFFKGTLAIVPCCKKSWNQFVECHIYWIHRSTTFFLMVLSSPMVVN